MLDSLNEILDLFLRERRQLSAIDVVELMDRPRSSVYRLLNTFHDKGFLDRDEVTGRYRLAIRFAALGELAQQTTSLQQIAMPVLQRLVDQTKETATLILLSGSDAVTVAVVESPRPLAIPGLIGNRVPLYATAGGKALLAWRDAAEVRSFLPPTLPPVTPFTITDHARLEEDLAISRDRGYTKADGEWIEGIVAVGAPIRNHLGRIEAALTVDGLRARVSLDNLERMADAVMRGAEEVSRNLGYRQSEMPLAIAR